MKKILNNMVLIFCLLLCTSLSYAEHEAPSFTTPLENIAKTKVTKLAPNSYSIEFYTILKDGEKSNKTPYVFFVINEKSEYYPTKLDIKLSNNGVEEKTTVKIKKDVLLRIIESYETLVRVGCCRDTIITDNFRDEAIKLLAEK